MRAVVLAGDSGQRWRPYAAVLPKPLMPVGDRPVLDLVIRQLRRHRVERVTIAAGHLAELIEALFRDGEQHGVAIDYQREHAPLGTAGALAGLRGGEDALLVTNGAVLTDLDYSALMRRHEQTGAAVTIASIRRDVQVSLGVLGFGEDRQPDRLTSYDEKPRLHFEASTGVYAVSPHALEYLRPGEPLDFPAFVGRLLDAGEPVHAFRSDCCWLDLGHHEGYEQALEEFERLRPRFGLDAGALRAA
jgi:NDP-sugar pyrophosphorylase family protein